LNIIHLAWLEAIMIAFIIRQASITPEMADVAFSRGTECAHMFYDCDSRKNAIKYRWQPSRSEHP